MEHSDGTVTFVAATALEYKALRRALPRSRIVHGGIALARSGAMLGDVVVSFGLAGGLRTDVGTGTVLIPREVRCPDGTLRSCDPELVESFASSARRLGIEPLFDPLLTSENIVCGAARAHWASQGYAAADMETGLICASRLAAVRVVLDTPLREISGDWQSPLRAMLKPWNWPQAFWLMREAPRAVARAAAVVAGAEARGGAAASRCV
ncbi:MAG: hypothetical protein JOZ77_01195 [Candidatus Eremiobacteraeota bacterium]|nr:hypothetical protein [Candidatus Eremiobacteraeota bacterium]